MPEDEPIDPEADPQAKEDAKTGKPSQNAEQSTEQQLADATAEIRTTAKWLVATFGAVGGALIAGISLSDLGDLEGSDKTVATIGAAVGIVSVTILILAAASVLTAKLIVLSDLQAWGSSRFWLPNKWRGKSWLKGVLNRNPAVHPGFESVESFARRILKITGDQVGARREQLTAADQKKCPAYETDPKYREAIDAKFDKAKAKYQAARNDLKWYRPALVRLLAQAQYEFVRERFQIAKYVMAVAAITAAIGVGMFAVSSSSPADVPEPAVASEPVLAAATLSDEETSRVQGAIGANCSTAPLPVIVTGVEDDGDYEVITVGAGAKCDTTRLTLSQDQTEITPEKDALGDEIILPPG